jgi:hypothetical protein
VKVKGKRRLQMTKKMLKRKATTKMKKNAKTRQKTLKLQKIRLRNQEKVVSKASTKCILMSSCRNFYVWLKSLPA